MEFRRLGGSGFSVPVLSFGTGTFGGKGEFFAAWGTTDVKEARRLVDICLEAGLTCSTAPIFIRGRCRRGSWRGHQRAPQRCAHLDQATFRTGKAANDVGSSRSHLIEAVEGSLRVCNGHIDLFQLHAFDAMTPSRRPSRRSTFSCAPARSDMSAARISPAGI